MAKKEEEQKKKATVKNTGANLDEDQFPSLDTAVAEFEQARLEEEK